MEIVASAEKSLRLRGDSLFCVIEEVIVDVRADARY